MTEHNFDPTQQGQAAGNVARPQTQARRSPRAVRTAAFNRRMRGYDENEVREFLASLADEVEVADAERTALRAEIERLRHERRAADAAANPGGTVVDPQSVALFSQAQQVADRVVAEAVEHAKDLMANAREQQRDILKKAHSAAELAAAKAAEAESVSSQSQEQPGRAAGPATESGYERPIPEVEYVRTFARVAQVQLKSVLDALTEQVEKLGDLPDMSETRGQGQPTGRHTPTHQELPESGTGRPPSDQPPRLERRSRLGLEPFGSHSTAGGASGSAGAGSAGAGTASGNEPFGTPAGPTDRPNPLWP